MATLPSAQARGRRPLPPPLQPGSTGHYGGTFGAPPGYSPRNSDNPPAAMYSVFYVIGVVVVVLAILSLIGLA
jgi:hypothetical protein